MMVEPDEIHVWYRFTDAIDDVELSAAVALLSSDEQIRYSRFHRHDDRRDYAAAHALLRSSLSRYGDVQPVAWKFESNAHGKPSLVHSGRAFPALSFNLSHAHGLVACAVAPGGDVGVDVESIERAVDWAGVATRYFSAVEIAQLESCPHEHRAIRFIELWTLKEAYVKAIGVGLSEPLNNFGFDLDHGPPIRFTPPSSVEDARWQFALFAPDARYRIAVAIAGEGARVWRITARSFVD